MFEFKAYDSKGEAVYPNPENQIAVDFVSNNMNKQMNLYYFDTIKGNWNYIAQDSSYNSSKNKALNNNKLLNSLIRIPVFGFNYSEMPIYLKNPRIDADKKFKFQFYAEKRLTNFLQTKKKNKLLKFHYEHKPLTKEVWVVDQSKTDSLYKDFDNLFTKEKIIKKRVLGVTYYKTINVKFQKLLIKNLTIEPNHLSDNYLVRFTLFNKKYDLKMYPQNRNNYPDAIQNQNSKLINYEYSN